MKFGNERESKNYDDVTQLQGMLKTLRGNPDGYVYNRNHIQLSDHEQDMYNRGMSLPDIMYIRAIKQKIVPDDSGFSMVPDNTVQRKPYKF